MTGETWAFVDLDGTLVFSRRALLEWDGSGPDEGDYVCVDRSASGPVGWVSARTAELVRVLESTVVLVPATARSIEQFRRMTLFSGIPRHAIVDNGAVILTAGTLDPEWDGYLRAAAGRDDAPLDEIARRLADLKPSVRDDRILVIRAETDAAAQAVEPHVRQLCGDRGWRVERDHRRVYVTPAAASKRAAAAWLADRESPRLRVAAGDSELDRGLLEWADRALVPAHALVARDPIRSKKFRVTPDSGSAASARLCEWIAQAAVE